MTLRYPRVLDHTALVALMSGHPAVNDLLDQAERGLWNLIVPAACVADAEQQTRVGHASWEVVLSTAGVVGLELSLSAAVDCGQWPGSLPARHAAYEAIALRAVVGVRVAGDDHGRLPRHAGAAAGRLGWPWGRV